MERLTERNDEGDLLLNGEEVSAGDYYEAISALEDYEDAAEQGRLLYPPNGALVVWDISSGTAKPIPLVNLFVAREGAEEALRNGANLIPSAGIDNEKLTTMLKMGYFPVTDDFWYAALMPSIAKEGFTWAFPRPLSRQRFMPYHEEMLAELSLEALAQRADINLRGI